MERNIAIGIVLTAILIVGAVFVSAGFIKSNDAENKQTPSIAGDAKCGCGCNGNCGGNCGIEGCSCGR